MSKGDGVSKYTALISLNSTLGMTAAGLTGLLSALEESLEDDLV